MLIRTSTLAVIVTAVLQYAVVCARLLQPVDVVSLPRPGSPSASPNGQLAVYAESTYHPSEDKTTKNLFLVDLATSVVTELTKPSFNISQSDPFFLDDNHVAFFQHDPSEHEVDQLYVKRVTGESEAYRLTGFPIEFSNVKYNRNKRLLVFSAMVYGNDNDLEGTNRRDRELRATKKDSGLVYDQLMVRHWDHFVPDKKNNLFAAQLSFSGDRYSIEGRPRNLLRGTNLQSPGFPLGGASDFDISPDGEEIAFVSKIPSPDNAWQTTQHVYIVPTSGQTRPIALNADIPAASSSPTYSPSGTLAYLQMMVPQYESDRNRIVLYDRETGARTMIAQDWDRSPSELTFSADAKLLFAVAQEHGREKLFAIDLKTESVRALTQEHSVSSVSVLGPELLLLSLNSMQYPNALHTLSLTSGDLTRLPSSPDLDKRLRRIEFLEPEEFSFEGALGDLVHGWLIKPADFDPAKSYPVAFLIHGGPQGAWTDSWSTRWNPQVFAGAGFVTVAINPHGSTGYGQRFTDSIQHNWGSYPYYDLEKGLDYLLSRYEFLDPDRLTALGASYGGYMINWLNGHTDRFKAFVNHDGMFSTVSTYYSTDELYFPEREFGGTPFSPLTRLVYERWSPVNYVQNWKTPTLVIHGGRDYRLVDGEGFSTFTALQRLGIPSRLLYFPDENHWTLKPANSLRWHKEVLNWITKWTTQQEPLVTFQTAY